MRTTNADASSWKGARVGGDEPVVRGCDGVKVSVTGVISRPSCSQALPGEATTGSAWVEDAGPCSLGGDA